MIRGLERNIIIKPHCTENYMIENMNKDCLEIVRIMIERLAPSRQEQRPIGKH